MDPLASDIQDLEHHLPSPADLFFRDEMASAADQVQQKDPTAAFLNSPAGNNMGMAGVMAALQSLGGNSGAPNNSEDDQAVGEEPGGTQGQGQLREQIMLEQFKLAQLKQLQELQQQIFQQQMALINGGTVSLDGQPRDQHERAYLPTPGSSTELRPSQPIPVEFVSPMMLNYNDGLSLDSSASHTFSQHDPAGLDMDMVNYAAMTHTHFGNRNGFPDSSPFVGNGSTRAHEHYFTRRGTASAPAHIAFGDPYQQSHNLHMGAMNPMTEPSSPMHSDLDFDISPLTSPWLGAKMTGSGGSNGRVQAYGHQHHSQNHHRQNQQGLHPPVQAGTKRAASPSMADIDVDVVFPGNTGEAGRSRKRQASISQSPNTMRPTVSPVTRPVNSNTSSSRSGSRSMNSTPLLRGTNPSSRTRRGSVVMGSPLTMAMGASGMNAGSAGFSNMQNPLGSKNASSSIRGMGINSNGNNEANSSYSGNAHTGYGPVGDSPSPVDLSLSMPPPAAPASAFGSNGANSPTLEPLVPVTPASIMNLGGSFVGLGGGLGSNNQAQLQPQNQAEMQPQRSNISPVDGSGSSSGNTPPASMSTAFTKTGKGASRNAKSDKDATSAGPTGTRKSGRKAAGTGAADNGTLKHILPAGGNPSSSSTLRVSASNSTGSSTSTILPMKERKTSHKAAEQKRRDSLKNTFDDLRGLLPPIPLPTDGDSKSGAAVIDDGSGIGFMALAKASLLPGALPPRGPPKAGGEGPNKGVSKLQLLICGNEYIRVLKGRVERRDDEVARLRREVRRLRGLRDGGIMDEELDRGGGGEGGEMEGADGMYGYNDGDMLDLDRDLDAVEVLESMRASGSGTLASANGGGMLSGVEEDVEED